MTLIISKNEGKVTCPSYTAIRYWNRLASDPMWTMTPFCLLHFCIASLIMLSKNLHSGKYFLFFMLQNWKEKHLVSSWFLQETLCFQITEFLDEWGKRVPHQGQFVKGGNESKHTLSSLIVHDMNRRGDLDTRTNYSSMEKYLTY